MSQKKPADGGGEKARLEREHPFRFNCYSGVSCFTQCCQDITIVLTPFDVLRLKNSLEISSDEFLEKHTIIIPKKNRLIPLVILKMNEEDKKCPFVTPEGCTVYDDRPWPCRMYPLDMNDDGTFSLITDSSRCKGLNEDDKQKISDWLEDQGIAPYDEMNEHFSSLTIQLQAQELDIDNPKVQQMTFMALYNLDKFRDFVFKSTFLDRLEVEPERIEKIRNNDEDLLLLAFDWIKFGLFGKKVFWVK
ncbi:MAG: YkgJ family cysteine cluster protein [Proteobacteria bacterium]|nr:YkgJ family cysteine cluster protein [Pseudomonadota bacterium]